MTDNSNVIPISGQTMVTKPCLWVAYRCMADNGMMMSSDGFYEGSLPITPALMTGIKSEITAQCQAYFNSVKPVDAKGNLVVGVPKPKVRAIEICAVATAEVTEKTTVN